MNGLWFDLRSGLRGLRRSPGFAVSAIGMLAAGIGACTAVFGIVNAILLRPLDLPDPERLVVLCETNPKVQGFCIASPPDVEEWRATSRSLASLGLGRDWHYRLSTAAGSEGVNAGIATPALFTTLGIRPQLGRLFAPDDVTGGEPSVTILTDELWRSRFGSDPGVLGRTLTLDGVPRTIVGVLPAGLRVPGIGTARVWLPLPFDPRDEEQRSWRGFTAIGRLRPGVLLSDAGAELGALAGRMAREHPATNQGWGVRVEPVHEFVVGSVRPALLLFSGAVALVLLVVCANAANLLLVRASRRRLEFAIRAANGAGRGRLLRQLLAESAVLSVLGAVGGFLLAWWATGGILALAPSALPRSDTVGVDRAAFLFALGLAAFTTVVFGLVPGLRAGRGDLPDVLRTGGRTDAGARRGRARDVLVVAELAVSLVLLVGAGLLLRSFAARSGWDPGFERSHVLTIQIFPPADRYAEDAQIVALYRRATAALAALPGVLGAGSASAGPAFGGRETGEFTVEGDAAGGRRVARWFDVDSRFLPTLGVPVVRGREFDPGDDQGSSPVALVNETFARRAWPGRDPLGRMVRSLESGTERRVVGVVRDVPPMDPDGTPEPEIYWPQAQAPRGATYLVVRTAVPPASLVPTIRSRLAELDPDLEVAHVRTLDEQVSERLAGPRFELVLVGLFAGLALLLSLAGLYAVIAFAVAQRGREFGVRLALGSTPRDLVLQVVGEGARLVMVGLALGAVLSLAATRLLGGLIAGVTATDPLTYFAVAALLAVAALAASAVPALRAARGDPVAALREG